MSGFVKTPTERELEILRHRLDKLETRVEVTETLLENSLGSSVPPASESGVFEPALGFDPLGKPPLTSRADSKIPERGRSLTRVDSCDVTCPNCCRPFVVSVSIDGPWPALPESLSAGGPPTPDLAAQPDSTTTDLPPYDPATGTGFHPRIGVHDYASLVSCLRVNFKLTFGEDEPLTDPQGMIQRMTAEIQGLRRLGSLDLKGGGVQGDGNDARSSATEDRGK